MNLQDDQGSPPKRKELLFLNFNQDASCVSAGTVDGFCVFNCEPFTKAHEQSEGGGLGICEMLFCTSLVAVVGSGDQPTFSPRKLRILNTHSAHQQTICELNFVSSILAVKLNMKRMIVVMETKIHVYDINTLKILHSIDTVTNPEGLAALCPGDNSYVAYPGTKGDVLIFDALNLSTVNVIEKAHKGSISTLAFNDDGTLLATSSTKGTVIRVFSIPEAKKLYEFRRGSYPARIFSIAFSRDSSLLAASSESGTVHVFQVDKAAASTSGSSMTASFMGFSSYLPEVVSDIWQPVRAFAQVKLPSPCPSLCGIAKGNDLIYVVTAEGYFYQYKLDLHAGGECKMVGEFTLFESKSEEVAATFLD